ncbi:MAG: hypothetical protein H7A47_14485 [Verrucomicrobiales bacterium]|nr:hypothetical protein [Verrucomicrobiales bacterium]
MRTAILNHIMAVTAGTLAASAALNIPSDGSDGALVISSDTEIDLGLAATGNWDADNTANAGNGIYDPEKWAVVFKYSSVTVNEGATVTFRNHPSRGPVVWLVSGDVVINGAVNLDGQDPVDPPALAEPGPGGFRGGSGNTAPGAEEAAGFGPGGAGRRVGDHYGYYSGGGSYGSEGRNGQPPYGNPALIPLLGGSGGGGRSSTYREAGARGGGGGGGAILIACAGDIHIQGEMHANGGNGRVNGESYQDFCSGSGGGIRLVSEILSGGGSIQAVGGGGYHYGGLGRIRIERVTNNADVQVTPDPSIVPLVDGSTPQIWMPVSGPMVRIVSIGGTQPPADPRAEFNAIGADVVLPQTASLPVVVETTNVEDASVVTVRVTPRSNADFAEATATVSEVVNADPLVLRWTAEVPVNDGYSAVQVKVVRP